MNMFPAKIPNWIDGSFRPAFGDEWLSKVRPTDGACTCTLARSRAADINLAVAAAGKAQCDWASMPAPERGVVLGDLASLMYQRRTEIAHIVADETGKSLKDANGETAGAIALARFWAGEGQRLYGRTNPSSQVHRYTWSVRQPIGICGLIIAANTPIANVAWKVFPALLCGNTAVLKAAEDTPATAWYFAQLASEAGLPRGVLNVVQGLGVEAGAPIAAHSEVGVVSFTGSTAVGRQIGATVAARLGRVSLELGGKNPFVVCDDADLDLATKWALLSAFSNAGQRCASASRIIVFDAVYEKFRDMLADGARKLSLGPTDDDHLGPVINQRQCQAMLAAVERVREGGGKVLVGGQRLMDEAHRNGFYVAPTLIENVDVNAEISTTELFGPIACLYRVPDFDSALVLANNSPYGLTACIHTRNVHRAMQFVQHVQAGVAVVNAATYGSEPHLPFGGVKASGNGSREPGTEALDVYSELKQIYFNVDVEAL